MADRYEDRRNRRRGPEHRRVEWSAWGEEAPEDLYWGREPVESRYWRGGEPYESYEPAGSGRVRAGAALPSGAAFSEEESGDTWMQFFAPAVEEPYAVEESEPWHEPYRGEEEIGEHEPYGGERFWYGRESHPRLRGGGVPHDYEYGQLYGYPQRNYGQRRDSYYATAAQAQPGLGREDAHRPGRYGGGPRRRESYRGRGPRGYRRSDERICDEVVQLLTDASWVDASDVEVRVEDGEVYLEGHAEDRQSARAAEVLAAQVMGVEEVHNRLRRKASGAGLGAEAEAQ